MKKFFNCAAADARQRGEVRHLANVLQHLASGSAAAVTVAESHKEYRRARVSQTFLLNVIPSLQRLFRRGGGTVGAIVTAARARSAEMGEDARPVQTAPPKGVIG